MNAGKQRWCRTLKSRFVVDLCPASVFLRARDFAIAYLQFAPA
jgi:hypothetical protein